MLLNEMEIFYYVAEFKSFSKAAEKLGVSKSFISKRISKLEKNLKVRLITRSTRKLVLTEAGENFYQQCIKVVEEANKGYSLLSELQGKPVGTLKVSAPPALGMNLLAKMLPKFLRKYPDVSLDIELENRLVDLIAENYDLVLRSAKLEDSNLIAQRIFTVKNVICATPEYIKINGRSKTLKDLEKHNFASYSYAKDAKHLKFIKNNSEEIVLINGKFVSNQLDLIKKMVLSHICMAVLPEFMITHELKTNQLKLCLTQYQLPESPLYAIYPERNFIPLKLKVFLEMLKDFLNRA